MNNNELAVIKKTLIAMCESLQTLLDNAGGYPISQLKTCGLCTKLQECIKELKKPYRGD